MVEVDHGTLSPSAFWDREDMALFVVHLAGGANLTFLDLYEHWVTVFIWGAKGALAHLCP